jgi:hypothetical protein
MIRSRSDRFRAIILSALLPYLPIAAPWCNWWHPPGGEESEYLFTILFVGWRSQGVRLAHTIFILPLQVYSR